MVEHLDARAGLTVLGRLSARAEIIRNLQTRLRLADYWRAHPDVFDEEIVEPVFIVGPPRTGTSILLELLARDPGLRPVVAHEAHFPLGPLPGVDRTASEVSEPEQEFWADIHPDFQAMHELRSDLPCECVHFVQPEFRSWHWSMMFDLNDVPGRTTPKRTRRSTASTGSSCRPCSTATGTGPLPAQTPAHSAFFRNSSRRTPTPSSSSPIEIRSSSSGRPPTSPASCTGCDPTMSTVDSGPDHGGGLRDPARRGDATTHRRRVPAEQITDVHFRTLMADPVATIEEAYAALGVPFHESMRSSIPAYLESKPKGKFGIHRYDPARLGLDESSRERSSPTTSNTTASNWSTHE